MRFLQIALRNVLRNTRRTALTVLVLSCGSAAVILTGGFAAATFEGLRERTIGNGLGHLQIFTGEYLDEREDQPLQYGIANYDELRGWLEEQDRVAGATARIDFVGLISNGDKSEAFVGSGLEVEREEQLQFRLKLEGGENLNGEDDQVLLGVGLAESLNVQVGEFLTLLATTADGALNAIDVEVAGFFTTGISAYDARAIRVPLASAQRLLDRERVTKLIVKLEKTEDTATAYADLTAAGLGPAGGGLRIKTWEELATFYGQVVNLYNAIFVFMGLIIVVLVILSSSNTMMMAVLERLQEIGTLMALGTRRRQIVGIFLLEGALIGVLGGALGLLFSLGLIHLINSAEVIMPPPPSFSTGIRLVIKIVPGLFAGVLLMMMTTLTFASFMPALRGARMQIVKALGHV